MRIIERIENIEQMNQGYRMMKEFRSERHFTVQSYIGPGEKCSINNFQCSIFKEERTKILKIKDY
jgi:hypothetical protein